MTSGFWVCKQVNRNSATFPDCRSKSGSKSKKSCETFAQVFSQHGAAIRRSDDFDFDFDFDTDFDDDDELRTFFCPSGGMSGFQVNILKINEKPFQEQAIGPTKILNRVNVP